MVKNLKTIKKEMVAHLLGKIPSSRTKIQCSGCFAPRNTLTVKSHVEKIWLKESLEPTDKGVMLHCVGCGERRFLNLSSFSRDCFSADYSDPQSGFFILLKDDKYNSLVGGIMDEEIQKVLNVQNKHLTIVV